MSDANRGIRQGKMNGDARSLVAVLILLSLLAGFGCATQSPPKSDLAALEKDLQRLMMLSLPVSTFEFKEIHSGDVRVIKLSFAGSDPNRTNETLGVFLGLLLGAQKRYMIYLLNAGLTKANGGTVPDNIQIVSDTFESRTQSGVADTNRWFFAADLDYCSTCCALKDNKSDKIARYRPGDTNEVHTWTKLTLDNWSNYWSSADQKFKITQNYGN